MNEMVSKKSFSTLKQFKKLFTKAVTQSSYTYTAKLCNIASKSHQLLLSFAVYVTVMFLVDLQRNFCLNQSNIKVVSNLN